MGVYRNMAPYSSQRHVKAWQQRRIVQKLSSLALNTQPMDAFQSIKVHHRIPLETRLRIPLLRLLSKLSFVCHVMPSN